LESDGDDDDDSCVCFRQLFRGTRVGSKGLEVRVNVLFSLLDGDKGMLDVFRSERVKVRDAFLSLLDGDFDFLEAVDFHFDLAAPAGDCDCDGDCDGDEGCSPDLAFELKLELEFEMCVNVFRDLVEDNGEDDGDRDGNEGNRDADTFNERECADVRGVVVGVSGLSGSCSDTDAVAEVVADV